MYIHMFLFLLGSENTCLYSSDNNLTSLNDSSNTLYTYNIRNQYSAVSIILLCVTQAHQMIQHSDRNRNFQTLPIQFILLPKPYFNIFPSNRFQALKWYVQLGIIISLIFLLSRFPILSTVKTFNRFILHKYILNSLIK